MFSVVAGLVNYTDELGLIIFKFYSNSIGVGEFTIILPWPLYVIHLDVIPDLTKSLVKVVKGDLGLTRVSHSVTQGMVVVVVLGDNKDLPYDFLIV